MDTDFFAQNIFCFRDHGSFISKIKGGSSLCGLPRALADPALCMSTTIKKRVVWHQSAYSHFSFYIWCYIGTVYIWLKVAFSWAPLWLTGNRADPKMEAIIISALLLKWGALDRQKDREINKQTKGATASLAIFSVRGGFHGWGEF